jgi:hypothetical protein
MQNDPLAYAIAGKWKREYGWVCCANNNLAEPSGWWEKNSNLKAQAAATPEGVKLQFYDSSCGKLVYEAPVGRSIDSFIQEVKSIHIFSH